MCNNSLSSQTQNSTWRRIFSRPKRRIRVDGATGERLTVLADESGLGVAKLVADLAAGKPTKAELSERKAAAEAYIRKHFRPDFSAADAEAGEQIWLALPGRSSDAPRGFRAE